MYVAGGWLEQIAYAVAIVTAVASAYRYWRNSQRERYRWLFQLHDRFYGDPLMRKIRIQLDGDQAEFLQSIREEQDLGQLAELDDYLNFFEFVGFLHKKKALKEPEIRDMFDYPLRGLCKDQHVLRYIQKYGYELLHALLKKLRYAN